MSKKLKITLTCSVLILLFLIWGSLSYLKSLDNQVPMINIQANKTIPKKLSIEQHFLYDKSTLFESDQITNKQSEIHSRKNNGESSIVLVIDGVEETILGYLDTSDSLAKITLNVFDENSDLVVDYEVHTVFGEESGTMQVAFAQPK